VKTYSGRVIELELDVQGHVAAWLECPPGAVPHAGQVTIAMEPGSAEEVLSTPLFFGGRSERGFLGLPLDGRLPPTWLPGTQLLLRGPLGRGFRLPGNVRRLGLAALGATVSRLLPLAALGLAQGADVALFADQIPTRLPASVELQPLRLVSDSLGWMDFLALDLPREALPGLRHTLGLEHRQHLPCPMQVLVTSALPCAGLAACGACALPALHSWKLICEDGPVFDLNELAW
jgi:hypothetical protein